MNLREIVSGIRLRVVKEEMRVNASIPAREFHSYKQAARQMQRASDDLQSFASAIGRMPPAPGTLRAKIGAHLVQVVQRMLFWYTPQIIRFNTATARFAEHVSRAGERHVSALEEIHQKLHDLRTELRLSLRSELPPSNQLAVPDPGFQSFIAECGARLESGQEELALFFRELRRILEPAPAVAGKWLDLECGSGLWMQSIADLRADITGVESNAVEAARCEARGLSVVRMDPLEFLSAGSARRFAGITALRVLERHPMEWNFRLLRECARQLLPGGTILITGSDPASGVSAARDFWIDPRSLRPIPIETATAMLEHLGFQILNIRRVREWREEEKLPLAGLEPVRDLNACLFGPREYAVLARRAFAA